MKIKIHKGTDEIGGSCVELSTENTTILIDYGTPLKEDSVPLKVPEDIDAVLISHPHQDHFGEIESIAPSTPVYSGELSHELMNATRVFTGNHLLNHCKQIFKAWEPFTIGDFTITPYLVDHSATDAYAFLIEAEGKKVIYSGDFRANGRKAKLFDKMIINEKLHHTDALLMEGTMLHRSNDDFPDEKSVEEAMTKILTESPLVSYMVGSSQNIDSLVSAYRACLKSNRTLVVDIYTAWILERMKLVSDHIPNMNWEKIRVIKKFGGNYYQKIKEHPDYFGAFKSEVFNHTVDLDEIKENPSGHFLKVSPWQINRIMSALDLDDANVIYSQWLGYMEEEYSDERTVKMLHNLKERYNWYYAHTSGHADLDALQTFAKALQPKHLIPIHTEHKDEFQKYFEDVVVLDDGEVFNL